jgi:hypothetical protein
MTEGNYAISIWCVYCIVKDKLSSMMDILATVCDIFL